MSAPEKPSEEAQAEPPVTDEELAAWEHPTAPVPKHFLARRLSLCIPEVRSLRARLLAAEQEAVAQAGLVVKLRKLLGPCQAVRQKFTGGGHRLTYRCGAARPCEAHDGEALGR